jgi:hypothetical protein
VVSDVRAAVETKVTPNLPEGYFVILAFVMSWNQHHDLRAISRLARETLVLVPLGLPFFLPLAFAEPLGLGLWPAFVSGFVLASITVAAYFSLVPAA